MYYFLSFLFFLVSFTILLCSPSVYGLSLYYQWQLVQMGPLSVNFSLLLDPLAVSFVFTVLLVTMSVVAYSYSYMNCDTHQKIFLNLLLLFVLSMSLFILIPNLLLVLLGWDGLGLLSYLLVIFYANKRSLNSGNITFMSNRGGDMALITLVVSSMDTLDMDLTMLVEDSFLLNSFLILAAMTKSAQIPFSAWLPQAMAAPTPVSSLVHSSTLVTAGAYLLIRFYPLVQSFLMLRLLSALTILVAGVSALFEADFKKIIALSTLSQIGFIMFAVANSGVYFGFFHLLSHAFFKSMIFLAAGVAIHLSNNSQELTMKSAFSSGTPHASLIFMLGSFSLVGLPFLSGFYSKDLMFEFSSLASSSWVILVFLLGVVTSSAYSARMVKAMHSMDQAHADSVGGDSFTQSFFMTGLLFLAMAFSSLFLWAPSLSQDLVTVLPPLYKLMPFIALVVGWAMEQLLAKNLGWPYFQLLNQFGALLSTSTVSLALNKNVNLLVLTSEKSGINQTLLYLTKPEVLSQLMAWRHSVDYQGMALILGSASVGFLLLTV